MRGDGAAGDVDRLMAFVAGLLALPVAAVIWFEAVYLWFGVTAADPPGVVKVAIATAAYVMVIAHARSGARQRAEVVLRACRLGIGVTMLLPLVTIAVLLIWVNAPARPDLGMGGLALYSIPVVAFLLSIVLVVAFGIGRRLALSRISSRTSAAPS